MKRAYKIRRSIAAIVALAIAVTVLLTHPDLYQPATTPATPEISKATGEAMTILDQLEVKGRAPKTNYSRDQFGDGWESKQGCDTRNIILHRDLVNTATNTECKIVSGLLHDPYTGKDIPFVRGDTTSDDVQIDHVVALSDAWQTGAQQLSPQERVNFANDPLELLAVDGRANQQKSDGDAATWLPSNKAFRCQYVARQIAIKKNYRLWVKQAEKDAMIYVLATCPGQLLPTS
ncbi:MAG TPA: HNH endonuclease family protein [Candidatus Saccharimonadales bacterium]|nr:HNH endonuclease family protein [Candidatus Saccharimonadales bacterium]